MSYGLRNTLILLAALLLMIMGSYVYLRLNVGDDLEPLKLQIENKQRELQQLSATADNFITVQEMTVRKRYEAENHNKELLADNNVATVFTILDDINSGIAFTSMNFSFRDSVRSNDHGILRISVNGEGTYRNLFNFLTILEQSKPITRVSNVRMAPDGSSYVTLNRVRFEMELGFYYARGTTPASPEMLTRRQVPDQIHNPFFALIHPIPENTDGLPDVDRSRLIGLTRAGAYIIDQNNEFKFLPQGSRVFLGTLQQINMNDRSAVFRLNRGGISDTVVLRINETD
jgi:hypothetical protein